MAAALTDTVELAQLIGSNSEWRLVRENGSSFPLNADEMEVTAEGGRPRFSVIAENGYKVFGLRSWDHDGCEIELGVALQFGRETETIRRVPRTSAAALNLEVEIARTKRAGEIAAAVSAEFPRSTLKRVSLKGGGRTAE